MIRHDSSESIAERAKMRFVHTGPRESRPESRSKSLGYLNKTQLRQEAPAFLPKAVDMQTSNSPDTRCPSAIYTAGPRAEGDVISPQGRHGYTNSSDTKNQKLCEQFSRALSSLPIDGQIESFNIPQRLPRETTDGPLPKQLYEELESQTRQGFKVTGWSQEFTHEKSHDKKAMPTIMTKLTWRRPKTSPALSPPLRHSPKMIGRTYLPKYMPSRKPIVRSPRNDPPTFETELSPPELEVLMMSPKEPLLMRSMTDVSIRPFIDDTKKFATADTATLGDVKVARKVRKEEKKIARRDFEAAKRTANASISSLDL